jgi:nucleoside-diphosphate-sugar epimerase
MNCRAAVPKFMLVNPLRSDLEFIAESTRGLWDELRQEHVLITGGTGFFGCWLVESFCFINNLLGLRAKATILTRNPQGFAQKCPHLASDPAVVLAAGDIRNFLFPEGNYKFVIHAATDSRRAQAIAEPLQMFSTILTGTERILEFAATHGTRKFLLTSSGAVYGTQPPDLTHVPETYTGAPDTLDPINVYAEGKRNAELLCAVYAAKFGIECKIARCWAFCGPYLPLDQHFAIANFIADVLAGRAIQIRGDGTPRRSYLYAAELAIWLWTILFRAHTMVPMNVGSADDLSIIELAQIVAATLKPDTMIQVAQQALPGAPPVRYVPCVDRAREMLGLRQTIGLEECIRRTAAWHANRDSPQVVG